MNTSDLKEQQLRKLKTRPGFIAALDQPGSSTPKTLLAYGFKENAWSNDEQMFALVHQMRAQHHQPQRQRRADSRRDPVRGHDGRKNREVRKP